MIVRVPCYGSHPRMSANLKGSRSRWPSGSMPGAAGRRRSALKVLFVNDSTSSSNWGDRAAAFSLKAMVAEAGATISGVITEDDLGLTQFGEPSADKDSSRAAGERCCVRSCRRSFSARAGASSRTWT